MIFLIKMIIKPEWKNGVDVFDFCNCLLTRFFADNNLCLRNCRSNQKFLQVRKKGLAREASASEEGSAVLTEVFFATDKAGHMFWFC